MRKDTKRLGFTLIELLSTLAIMAILSAMLFPFVANYTQKSKRATAYRSLKLFQDAINRHIAVNDTFTASRWCPWTPTDIATNQVALDDDIHPAGSWTGNKYGSNCYVDLTRGQYQTLETPANFTNQSTFLYVTTDGTSSLKFWTLMYSVDQKGWAGNGEYVNRTNGITNGNTGWWNNQAYLRPLLGLN
ncbi:MAG: type II secretion system protein [Verrucomicrobiota bacterium]